MNQDFRGAAPDPSELLVTVLTIAGLTTKLQERAAAEQNEILRVLRELQGAHQDLRSMAQQVVNLAEQLRQGYAPEAVQTAARGAQRAVAEFKTMGDAAFDEIHRLARVAARDFWLRTAGAAAIALVAVIAAVVLAIRFVPSLEQVQARRALMAVQPVQPVEYEGGRWVPVTEVQSLCERGDSKQCARYGRLP